MNRRDFPQPKTLLNLSRNLTETISSSHCHVRRYQPGGHRVVQDRVDGGVDVEHQAAEVEDVEVELEVDMVEYLVGGDDHPHGQHLEGEETGEEEEDDRAEHHDDLPPAPRDGRRLPRALLTRGRGVGAA